MISPLPPKVEEVKKEESVDPEDLLPEEFGLKGLAELRRAKWFSAMAAPLPSCVEAIRVMKDKARRDQVWGHLGDWALELLVERSLFSAGFTMSPSKSIMRIMEVLASGLLMPDLSQGSRILVREKRWMCLRKCLLK